MVDPVNPSGQTQSILSVGKSQKFEDYKKPETKSPVPVDEINLSDEARTLQNVEKTAKQVGRNISSDQDITLSAETERLNALI